MEQINMKFQLAGIELLAVNLYHPQVSLKPERKYHVNVNIEQRINSEDKLVVVITSVELIHEDDSQCHGSIKTSCIYRIENFQDFLTEKNILRLPDQFIVTLNAISLSTTRGIMFSSFKGTFLHDIFLPIVDPSAFVTNTSQGFTQVKP